MSARNRFAAAWNALRGAQPALEPRPIGDFIGDRPGRAYFDAAASGPTNRNHWGLYGSLDADSRIIPDLDTLRKNTAAEYHNNSYVKGIVDTLARDVSGTGPMVIVNDEAQIDAGDDEVETPTPSIGDGYEQRFEEWCAIADASGKKTFAQIINDIIIQMCVDGEYLGVLKSVSPRSRTADYPVKLRLLSVAPQRLMTPWGMTDGFAKRNGQNYETYLNGGIEFDGDGIPLFYYILKHHPGSAVNYTDPNAYEKVPASAVIYLGVTPFPGQSRSYPWLSPALELLAYLRRFTLAVIDAAEKGADMAVLLETYSEQALPYDIAPLSSTTLKRGSVTVAPPGYKSAGFKSEQPQTTFQMFRDCIMGEVLRCISMPFNIGIGNSAGYNFASGRLDHQVYGRFIGAIQEWGSIQLGDRLFTEWRREAELLPGYLPRRFPASARVETTYYWDSARYVEILKERQAQGMALGNRMTSYARECAREGIDYRRLFRQIAREKRLMKALDIQTTDIEKALNRPANEAAQEEESTGAQKKKETAHA
jgi:capsid protein